MDEILNGIPGDVPTSIANVDERSSTLSQRPIDQMAMPTVKDKGGSDNHKSFMRSHRKSSDAIPVSHRSKHVHFKDENNNASLEFYIKRVINNGWLNDSTNSHEDMIKACHKLVSTPDQQTLSRNHETLQKYAKKYTDTNFVPLTMGSFLFGSYLPESAYITDNKYKDCICAFSLPNLGDKVRKCEETVIYYEDDTHFSIANSGCDTAIVYISRGQNQLPLDQLQHIKSIGCKKITLYVDRIRIADYNVDQLITSMSSRSASDMEKSRSHRSVIVNHRHHEICESEQEECIHHEDEHRHTEHCERKQEGCKKPHHEECKKERHEECKKPHREEECKKVHREEEWKKVHREDECKKPHHEECKREHREEEWKKPHREDECKNVHREEHREEENNKYRECEHKDHREEDCVYRKRNNQWKYPNMAATNNRQNTATPNPSTPSSNTQYNVVSRDPNNQYVQPACQSTGWNVGGFSALTIGICVIVIFIILLIIALVIWWLSSPDQTVPYAYPQSAPCANGTSYMYLV